MKKLTPVPIYALLAYFGISNMYAQSINPDFFGQNAWYSNYTSNTANPANDTYLYPLWPDIAGSGVKMVRIGGNDFNLLNTPSYAKIVELIDNIVNNGMIPIMSVSFPNSTNNNANLSTDAQNAAALVEAINTTTGPFGSLYTRHVANWIIANEPDQCITCASGFRQGYAYDGTPSSEIQLIADYIKTFSIEMKKKDNTIKIIGPEISYYRSNLYSPLFVDGTGSTLPDISGLIPATYNSVSTGVASGKPFVDYLSVHIYPNNFTGAPSPTNRNAVINQLETPETTSGSLRWQLKQLNTQLATINASTQRASAPLKLVVTETNVDYANENSSTQPAIAEGNDNRSYIGGQWWAEWMGVLLEYDIEWVNFWSAVENTFGYIDYAGNKRSSYWHFKMMAENFKGTFLPNGYTTVYTNSSYYKAFAYKSTAANEIGVIIMNQIEGSNPTRETDTHTKTFQINFNNGTPSGANMLFKFNAGNTAIGVSGVFNCTMTVETTMLLVFDATTGALKRKETYSLRDAIRTTDTGPMAYITNATPDYLYDNYTNPAPLHSNITIGTGVTIIAGYNKTFTATNSIKLNGPFSSNGKTLSLLIDNATCYSNP